MKRKSRGLIYILIGTTIFVLGLFVIYDDIITLGAVLCGIAAIILYQAFSNLLANNSPRKTLSNPLQGIFIQVDGIQHIVTASSESNNRELIKAARKAGIKNGDVITFRGNRYAKKDNKYFLLESVEPFLGETYKTKTAVLSKIEKIIREFEGSLPIGAKSCNYVLLREYRNGLPNNHTFTDKDLYILTMNLCFDLLASGEFHLYAGELNPYSEALALWKVLKGCACWLQTYGYMTDDQYQDLCDSLDEAIVSVGSNHEKSN